MNVTLSYDEEFGELLDSLRSKYGEQIFEIEGIGSQLDLNKFSKEFFNTRVTADASIDANANVGDSTVVSYSVELTKPFEKLNSLYLLWKEMRRLYHTDVANKIIEMHISGDIYIHDLHSVNKPYSYARNTPLNIKLYNEETSTTMEDLFLGMMLHHDKVVTYDREYYDLCNDEIYVEDFDEASNSKIWTKVKYVIKHKRHNRLLRFTLANDSFELVVTEDHPMILKDGSIKVARDVNKNDLLKSWRMMYESIVKIEVVEDSAFNEYVYDITTESGTFIVDSLVVHNCFNFSTYDIMNKGLPMITKIKSIEPNYLYSFKSQLEQFVVIASNSTLGACMHHSQRILIRHDGLVKSITSKDFVEQYDMETKFVQDGHTWYTGNVHNNVEVYEHNKFVPIKRVFKSPYVDDIYTIKTKTGKTCKVNKHHIFKVLRNEEYVEVEAKDLQVYDTVINTLHGDIPIDKSHEDYRHGQFIGILCGDGCLTRPDWFGIAVGHSKEYLMDWMDEYVNDYYPNIKSTRYYNEEKHYWNYFMYNVKSQREIINKYFDKDNLYCHNKCPINMENKSLEFKLGFIDGIFVTDGSATSDVLDISLCNKSLVDLINSILIECGITHINRNIYADKRPNKSISYKLGFSKNWRNNFILFNKLKISKRNNRDGTERCYFGASAHKESTTLEYASIGQCSRSWKRKYTNDTYHDVIISIDKELNDEAYVYEIETDSHWYSCGGILTHNTGIADVLISMSYYVKNILATMSDAHFTFKDEAAVWTYVRETIASLIYTLNQPFRGGIQCVTENTEIYTPDGFKHYSELSVGDLVCTFDVNTHEFEFQPIQKMNVSKYSGMLDVYGKQHVTPNHRVLVNTSEDVYKLIVSEDIEDCVKIPQVECNGYYMFVADNVMQRKASMEYDGIVWCPTTAAGVVVFKNEDEVFISGNSSFTNVSIFDSNFLKDMSAMYIFPDGSTPDISIIQTLQRIYLDVMNTEMRRTAIVFPVTTACFSIDENKEFKDPDFVKEIIEYNKEFGFINLYSGKSTTLSSCCFDGYQEIFALVNDEWKYVRFSELHDNDEIFIMGVDDLVQAKLVKIDMGVDGHVMHIVRLVNDEQLVVTHDHIHPTSLGDKTTEQLSRSDSLILNTKFGKQNVKIESIDAYRSLERYVYCLEVINDAPYFTLANGILTHNCRLKSDMTSIGYSNSIGGSSTKIGSVGVTTLNLYRLAKRSSDVNDFKLKLAELVGVAARVNHARRTIIRKKTERGFAPLYTYEFISLDKQYSTCGVSGVYEALEALGEDLTSETGLNLAIEIVELINAENARYDKAFGFSHNTEQIPGESLSVKLADKDRLLGYNTEHDLYSNQFIPLTATADILERIRIQGALDSHFSGGSVMHLNFDKRIEDGEVVFNLLKESVKQGVIYQAVNYVLNECENGHMTVGNIECCSICGGQLSNKFSRIVGFLSNVKNWNKVRREKDFPNRTFYSGDIL